MKSLLITRPSHDLPTTYLYHWSSLVIKQAKKAKFKVTDLAKRKANPKDFNQAIEQKPQLVFLNGHGAPDEITGQHNQTLIKAGENEDCLKDKITYALSCQAGSILGKQAVKKLAKAFIGYREDFFLCYTATQVKKPLSDSTAKLFLEPSNLIPNTLINKKTVKQAYEASQKAMKENISYMLSSKANKTQKDAVPYLWSNIECQIVHGSKKAKI